MPISHPSLTAGSRPTYPISRAYADIRTSFTSLSSPAFRDRSFLHCTRAFEDAQADLEISEASVSRRRFVWTASFSLCSFVSLTTSEDSKAFTPPPPGYSLHQDKLDGYSFLYPEDWLPVTTTGNDVYYRSPFSIEESLFVDVSSPSSSKYTNVADLGTPEEVAKATLKQYLEEFMSTRLGVRREGEVISASSRTAPDGRIYYDIQTRARSYASRNQLAVTQDEISGAIELEWDRRYLTVLGVANGRLYQFRLQSPTATFEKDSQRLFDIAYSFRCKTL